MADSLLTVVLQRQNVTGTTDLGEDGQAQDVLMHLQALLAGLPVKGGKVTVQEDSSTGVAATFTLTCTQADATAGDAYTFQNESLTTAGIKLTAVAGSATAASGEFSIDTSDTAMATSLAAAINGYLPFKRLLTATSNAGVVTVTSAVVGAAGNNWTFIEAETTGTAVAITTPTNGADPGAFATQTITVTHANYTEDDTTSVGSVTLTWKDTAGTEDEVEVGTTDATDAAALAAAINAHSKLKGVVTATVATNVVTVTSELPGRYGELITLATSDATFTALGAAALSAGTTDAWKQSKKTGEFGR